MKGKDKENIFAELTRLMENGLYRYCIRARKELLLLEAALKNDVELTKNILSTKVDANAKDNFDRSPVHFAASKGHIEILSLLLQAKCDIEAVDKYGMTPLLMAAWFGFKEAVQILVEGGANCRAMNKGQTVLHCAVRSNHEEIVTFLIENAENLKVNAIDKNGLTPVHIAASNNCMEIVERLITSGADISIKDKNGRNPIHSVASKGHHLVLVRLLRVGIEIDDTDEEGKTPLHLATENGHQRAVEILLEHNCDPGAKDTKSKTALHIAAALGYSDVVITLHNFGACLNVAEKHGDTPLHLAVMGNHPHMVELLIKRGIMTNTTNARQQTALHLAAELGYSEVVEVLLACGADLSIPEKGGRKALYIAARGSYTAIVDMLIKVEREQKRNPSPDSEEQSNNAITDPPIKVEVESEELTSTVMPMDPENIRQMEQQAESNRKCMRQLLWTLAKSYLEPGDWKRLARHWRFTEEHIKAIEHQYTGKTSYKEHGYRMLLIWLQGVPSSKHPLKELFEALVAINKRDIAEKIRRKAEEEPVRRSCHANRFCAFCSIL